MKKIALTAAAVSILFTGAASAADMAPRYTKAPPPPVVTAYNWTGCYLGGYVGGATQSRAVNTADPTALPGGGIPAGSFYNAPTANAANLGLYSYDLDSSVIGGGTVGCNWQGASSFVIGVEGEGGYMKLKGSVIDPYSVPLFGGDTRDSTKIGDWYAALTGRVGFAWDRVLIYGKAGVGFANISSTVIDACNTGACGGALLTATGSSNNAFWVAGGGIEYAFSNNWSVKGEYLYLGIDKTYSVCGVGSNGAVSATFCSAHNIQGVHTGKFGVNYHFNSPVVARY
jgi:outer membrane immunogenic protein